ncbi:MAG: CvpA family protein [Bacilli bacterium]|nr:CvpA family protein [Bacilli bacterium]
MSFNFDLVLFIIAIFMFLSGLYFGFYNQLRRTLSSIAGLAAALFLTSIVANIISGLGSIKDIIAKVVNIFLVVHPDVAVKLLVGLIIYFTVKLIFYLIIGAFKRRDVKSFLKDKSATSCIVGGVLGVVNAYIIGLLLYILFLNIPGSLYHADVASKIFYLLPQVKEIVDAILALAVN